ncbi:MAG TPA: hypothetical protein VN943_00470 [Candidatus Acidoferrum sp.]|nr:hypothetical protein [Candidatus Acidoferrum sp.]
MTLEETIIGSAVSAVAQKLLDQPSRSRAKAKALRERLDILEAQRLVLTIELRSALLSEAKKLLPQAIRQARGVKGKPGSPALLRLIARLAMRNTQIEKR